MKNIINRLGRLAASCLCGCCLSVFTFQSYAIEGLAISVPSTNVVLSWPSDTSETYLIQYRHALDATDSWTTLADNYPPDSTTNVTCFYDTNIDYGLSGSSSGNTADGSILPMSANRFGNGGLLTEDEIIAMLMPPELAAIMMTTSTAKTSAEYVSPQPLSNGNDGSNTTAAPGTGFYRVVRDGVHIFGLTNGTVVTGTMQFPIEFALGSTDEIVGVSFYDDSDSPIIGATSDGDGNSWTLTWDTSKSFNGSYNIYAQIDFAADDSVASVPISVTVSNIISFPNYFSQIFGSQMWIYAETIPNAAYELDLYDENTNYLGSFFDSADSSGVISFLWDLTDGNGNTFTSTNFIGVWTVDTSSSSFQSLNQKQVSHNFQAAAPAQKPIGQTAKANGVKPNGGTAGASATTTWANEPSWSPGNSWAIAYSPLAVNDPVTTYRIQNMMVGGPGGEYGGVVSTLGNYGMGAPMSPGNVSQSSAFAMQDGTSKTNFLVYMWQSQYRHLYFFGHGSPSGFGTDGASINYHEIEIDLGNFMHSQKPALYHPYRFVFIDGCRAGSGNLCEAFGIPAMTVSTNYFGALGIPSRAFLGFKKKVSFTDQSLA